jgi:serine protease Do
LPAAEGALVLEVLPDSVALSAGVRKGDIILQVDETPIKHSGDVRPAVEAAGVDLTLLVLRGGERMTLKMILGDTTQDRR